MHYFVAEVQLRVRVRVRVIGCSEKNFKRGPFDLGQFEVAEHESELKKNRLIFFLGHPAVLLLGTSSSFLGLISDFFRFSFRYML